MTHATESNPPSPKAIDVKTFWRVLGERATGATIVTAQGADGPAGFLGLSATHVCADPPTMLVSIDSKTSALAAVLHARHFAINYLGRDARAIADTFAGKTAAKGAARFEPGRWGSLDHRRAGPQRRHRRARLRAGEDHRACRDHDRHRPGGRRHCARQRRAADLFSRQLLERVTPCGLSHVPHA